MYLPNKSQFDVIILAQAKIKQSCGLTNYVLTFQLYSSITWKHSKLGSAHCECFHFHWTKCAAVFP